MVWQQQRQQKIVNHNSLVQKNYALSIFMKVNGEKASRIGIIEEEEEEEEKNSVISFAKRRRISEEIHFIICQSCFWCASYIGTNTRAFISEARRRRTGGGEDAIPTKCPICIEGNIESMSVNENEAYKFDYGRKRGVILEFLK
jgi:hypothetical protein